MSNYSDYLQNMQRLKEDMINELITVKVYIDSANILAHEISEELISVVAGSDINSLSALSNKVLFMSEGVSENFSKLLLALKSLETTEKRFFNGS